MHTPNSDHTKPMKTKKTVLKTIAAVVACSMCAHAEKGDNDNRPIRKGPPKELIKKFDKDGDGELNEDEKAAMKTAMKKRHEAAKAKMLELFDANNDGKLCEDEKAAMKDAKNKKRKEIKTALLAKFDKNENGKLDQDEREGVREWMKENYPDARPPQKRHRSDPGKGKRGDKGPKAEESDS